MKRTVAELLATGDIDGLLAARRAEFGDIRMDGTPTPPTPPAPTPPAPTPPAPTPPTPPSPPAPPAPDVPQDQVNAIVARTKRETEAEVRKQVAESLGVDLDKAAELIKAAQDAESAKLSEAEKREKAAAEAERKATEREAAAVEREKTATIRAALATAGCTTKDDLADAQRLVEVTGDVTDETATAAVEELKKRRPELFKGTATPRPGGTPPAGAPPNHQGGPSSMAERRKHYREQNEAKAPAKTA